MSESSVSVLERFRRDESGNIAVILGASVVPLVFIMGGAVDLSRYTRYKAELSNAVDAAALALARKTDEFPECVTAGTVCAAAGTFVSEFVASMHVTDDKFAIDAADGITVTKIDSGFEVEVAATMDTIFLPLGQMAAAGGGIDSMNVDVTSEVVAASNRLELALVLDNTGSMNCVGSVDYFCATDWASPDSGSRIVALKTAANTLVDTLMRDDLTEPDQIKIALVPFESMVNVASTGFSVTTPPSWIDWSNDGKATWNGRNFNAFNVVGTSATERIGHKWLFDKLTAKNAAVKWAGCVEMRAGTYELSDAAPNPAIADSLYVPFFWPDEPDDTNGGGNNSYGLPKYQNNYMKDRASGTFSGTASERAVAAQKYTIKYSSNTNIVWTGNVAPNTNAATTPYESGPNKGCPKPIVPLTDADGKETVKTAITNMIAYWASGTYIPAGLIWGWHVLTEGAPYTQGVGPNHEDYDQTVKAIVLLTDGDNTVYGLDENHNLSRFSAYGYVKTPVLGSNPVTYQSRLGTTAAAAETAMNTKTATLCQSVKTNATVSTDDDIRLYTITFGTLAAATTTLMENCATEVDGDPLYYHAPTPSDLADIFVAIGEDLSNLHLSR